jgi:acyl-CoA synthetase (AMP-forming)/AMP-acid ligase II
MADLLGRAGGLAHPERLAARVSRQVYNTRVLARTGLIKPQRPDKVARSLWLFRRWGATPAGAISISAVRFPDEPAIIDDLGTLSFAELHRRTNALAHALSADGIGARDNVALMCRNHRYFIEATVALSKLGANTLYLNTDFAGPQIADVASREGATALVFDSEFEGLVSEAKRGRRWYVGWEGGEAIGTTLQQMIDRGARADLSPPPAAGRVVILTSGTTGTPKGAARSQPKNLDPAVSMFSRIPLRAREKTLISAPLFHSWGFAHFSLGLALATTYVLQRRFDPESALAAITEQRPTAMAVVPVMLQRLQQLSDKVRRKYDTSSLRVVAVSGSALPGELANAFMDEYGDILYNLYGSTEVAWATIATPDDLRAAPGTAGRPPHGTVIRLFDVLGKEVPPGQTGRIFVSNEFLFEGYTDGGSKASIEGLLATGDVGQLDDAGRLFVEGRDDEMIVSGGENVFPAEVEDLISRHPGVAEVAVIGVRDPDFGQRLKAFVVPTGKKPTEDQIKSYVRSNLARYKVPRDVEFVEELPRNATGKVIKRELVQRQEPQPLPQAPPLTQSKSPSRPQRRGAKSRKA